MKYLNLLFLLPFLFSCHDKRKEEITQLVSAWQGKEIRFPQEMVFTLFTTDTVAYRMPQSVHKVLVFVDSVGCTSCKLQLQRWKELIQYTDSVTQGTVPFLFFFQSKNRREIRYLLKRDNFDRPVCLDESDALNRLNRFPSDSRFHTFLLDKENRVVLVGNPIHSLSVKELYLTEMVNKPIRLQVKTRAEVSETSVDLGTMKVGESKEAVFRLTNAGEHPLVIVDVATSCGCADPSYDKRPANPGETLQVKVSMTPNERGYFAKVITVKCNTNQLIRLTVKGTAQ